jgi:hypothetical protein
MEKRSFIFNPKFCLIKFGEANSKCVFDLWSIHHFYWQGFFYLLVHHILKIKTLKNSIILTILFTLLHILEEYFGNIGLFSFEGLFIDYIGPIVNPKINIKLRKKDNDYLDNSIGDVISGLFSNILIIFYWYHFKKLPYNYLLFSIFVLYLLYNKSYMLYNKK